MHIYRAMSAGYTARCPSLCPSVCPSQVKTAKCTTTHTRQTRSVVSTERRAVCALWYCDIADDLQWTQSPQSSTRDSPTHWTSSTFNPPTQLLLFPYYVA